MKELHLLLSVLIYVVDYYHNLAKDNAILYTILKKNPSP